MINSYFYRARCYLNSKRYDRAIADFDEVIKRRPKDTEAYGKRGSVEESGDLKKAIRDWDQAIKLDPRDPFLFIERGEAHRLTGQAATAVDDLTEAIRIDPNRALSYIHRAEVFSDIGENKKAVADCTEGIRIDPDDPSGYAVRGQAWCDMGRYEEAAADLGRAILLDPGDSVARCLRGMVYSRRRNDDKALEDLTESIRLEPTDAAAYLHRGYTWARKGDFGKAIADYQAALRIAPDDIETRNFLGYARAAAGDFKNAIAEFDLALRQDPGNLLVQFNRTVASFLSGDGAAVSAFRAIVERDDWQTEFSIDAAILGYFAALRSNQKDQAAALLKAAADQYGNRKAVWPYPIVRFLRGEIDEPKLLASAKDDEKIDHYYLERNRASRRQSCGLSRSLSLGDGTKRGQFFVLFDLPYRAGPACEGRAWPTSALIHAAFVLEAIISFLPF